MQAYFILSLSFKILYLQPLKYQLSIFKHKYQFIFHLDFLPEEEWTVVHDACVIVIEVSCRRIKTFLAKVFQFTCNISQKRDNADCVLIDKKQLST